MRSNRARMNKWMHSFYVNQYKSLSANFPPQFFSLLIKNAPVIL
jgi:hypothetical protein